MSDDNKVIKINSKAYIADAEEMRDLTKKTLESEPDIEERVSVQLEHISDAIHLMAKQGQSKANVMLKQENKYKDEIYSRIQGILRSTGYEVFIRSSNIMDTAVVSWE